MDVPTLDAGNGELSDAGEGAEATPEKVEDSRKAALFGVGAGLLGLIVGKMVFSHRQGAGHPGQEFRDPIDKSSCDGDYSG